MKDGQVVKNELNAFEQKHVKNETKVQNAAFKVGDKIKTKGKVGEVTDIDSRSVGAFGDVVTYKMKWPDGTESWEGNLHVLGTKVNEVEEEVKENAFEQRNTSTAKNETSVQNVLEPNRIHPYIQDTVKHLDAACDNLKAVYKGIDHPETKKELVELANQIRNLSIKVAGVI